MKSQTYFESTESLTCTIQNYHLEPLQSCAHIYLRQDDTTPFQPFDTVMIKSNKNGNFAPAIVQYGSVSKNKIILSKELLKNLNSSIGDSVTVSPLYNIPILKKVVIQVESDTEQLPTMRSHINKIFGLFKEKLLHVPIRDKFNIKIKNIRYTFSFKDNPHPIGLISASTIFSPSGRTINTKKETDVNNTFDIVFNWPLYFKEEFKKLDIKGSKGIILHGPPGCGKTHKLKQLKNFGYNIFTISGPQVLSSYGGQSESNIKKIFKRASEEAPAIVLIDQIDSICSKREQTMTKIVNQLLVCMDGLDQRGEVYVVATTNRIDSLDQAIRRPGRLDKEILVGPPTPEQRQHLLKIFIGKAASTVNIKQWAVRTTGCVHADLKYLVDEAKIYALTRYNNNDKSNLENLILTDEDLEQAYKKMDYSLLRRYGAHPDKKTRLVDVIGYHDIKQKLIREITYPTHFKDEFDKVSLKPLKGCIISGPPGCGKSHLLKAISNELDFNFLSITSSDLVSKYVGETEQNIKQLFQRARYAAPCIIAIDEIDALLASKPYQGMQGEDRAKIGTFLTQMDGLKSDNQQIVIIGTTNKPHLLDSALTRAGRFELALKMDYPNYTELSNIFAYYFNFIKTPLISTISKAYKCKFTGADTAALKRMVVMEAISTRKDLQKETATQENTLELSVNSEKTLKQNEHKEEPFKDLDDEFVLKVLDKYLKLKQEQKGSYLSTITDNKTGI